MSGIGFWRWGLNNVLWTVTSAALSTAFIMYNKNGINDVVETAQSKCSSSSPNLRASCAATIFNEVKSISPYDSEKSLPDEINFIVGDKAVTLYPKRVVNCTTVAGHSPVCSNKITYTTERHP